MAQSVQERRRYGKIGSTRNATEPLDAAAGTWQWRYVLGGKSHTGELANPGFALDYRNDRQKRGKNVLPELLDLARNDFMARSHLRDRLRTWSRDRRVQTYVRRADVLHPLEVCDLLAQAREALYDTALAERGNAGATRMLLEAQRDIADKLFHKLRYDIDRRHYRYEIVRQATDDEPGDFIDQYRLTCEFDDNQARRAFEDDGKAREQLQLDLKEDHGNYHIYAPLLGGMDNNERLSKTLKKHKLRRVGISPDSLNAGERKFLRDILDYIDTNFLHDPREFYLMRNVESLRSIGVYLDGETRVFYPDFVLWIVDDKAHKTTLALFDPKGQTGIVKDDDLGLNGEHAMNDKVRVSRSGQLAELARQLKIKTRRHWDIHSFILLRDISPLGRWKGSAPTDPEMKRAEDMIKLNVLRLDWHKENESGQTASPLRDGGSYLSRIFDMLCA